MFNFFKKNLKQKVEANKMHNKLKLIKKNYEYYKSNIYYNERNLKNLPSCRDNFGDNLDEKDGDGGVGGNSPLTTSPHISHQLDNHNNYPKHPKTQNI